MSSELESDRAMAVAVVTNLESLESMVLVTMRREAHWQLWAGGE
jgi:hypothetical protein